MEHGKKSVRTILIDGLYRPNETRLGSTSREIVERFFGYASTFWLSGERNSLAATRPLEKLMHDILHAVSPPNRFFYQDELNRKRRLRRKGKQNEGRRIGKAPA